MIAATFPRIHARYLEDLLPSNPPPEPRSSCHDCAMHNTEITEALGLEPFHAKTKCCTWAPKLANFKVGNLLLEGEEGGRRVAAAIASRQAATPVGVYAGPARAYHNRDATDTSFGRDLALRCPYLDTDAGRCTIWTQRDPTCATWYCLHERGLVAADFWTQLRQLLYELEHAASSHCVLELAPELMHALYHPDGRARSLGEGELSGFIAVDGELSEATHARLWGRHGGRELEFYRACAELVQGLSVTQLRALGGARIRVIEARVLRALEAVQNTSFPPQLARSDRSRFSARFLAQPGPRPGTVLISRERLLAPLLVRAQVMEALESESPASPEQWAQRLGEDRGQLRALVDHGVLEAARDESDESDEAPAPLSPTTRLFVSAREVLQLELGWTETGAASVVLRWGAKEFVFEDPEVLEFARELSRQRAGFVAGDALGWRSDAGGPSWEDVEGVFAELLELGVLERG